MAIKTMAGYSGTPLLQKLGFKPPMTVLVAGAPPDYESWLGELPAGLAFRAEPDSTVEAAHLFFTERAALEEALTGLRRRLAPSGLVWISWPKKSSKVSTDITEDVVRELALPLGFVDVKVCAVSDIWSGLKLVIRKSERSS
jgi:hypothetical protein